MRLGDGPIRVTGQISAESLPLPLTSTALARSAAARHAARLGRRHRAASEAGAPRPAPALTDLRASVTLQDGTLRLDSANASLAGGVIEGATALRTLRTRPISPPRPTFQALNSPGRCSARRSTCGAARPARTSTSRRKGYSPAALLSTLSGEASATLRDGAVTGFDLTGAGAALAPPTPARRDSLARAAVQGGMTAFSTLDLAAQLRDGIATLTAARLPGPGGTATATGSVDLHGSLARPPPRAAPGRAARGAGAGSLALRTGRGPKPHPQPLRLRSLVACSARAVTARPFLAHALGKADDATRPPCAARRGPHPPPGR